MCAYPCNAPPLSVAPVVVVVHVVVRKHAGRGHLRRVEGAAAEEARGRVHHGRASGVEAGLGGIHGGRAHWQQRGWCAAWSRCLGTCLGEEALVVVLVMVGLWLSGCVAVAGGGGGGGSGSSSSGGVVVVVVVVV